jgi:hypothetical protein
VVLGAVTVIDDNLLRSGVVLPLPKIRLHTVPSAAAMIA